MIKELLKIIIIFTLTYSCASIGSPQGEEKDDIPPKVLSETPKNFSTNFKEKKIEIEFDEFIITKDLRKQLIISPPLKKNPLIKPEGLARKKLTIEFDDDDTLKENTTYTFNFVNSIQDFNENNPLRGFKYVFSTGNFIDSLKINAEIKDAFSKDLDKNIFLVLYKIDSNFSDSTIINETPDYISNFLDSNFTSITNIKEGKYMLLAIKDNGNLKYDIKLDKIAFLDSNITLKNTDYDSTLIFKLNLFSATPPFKFLRATHTENGIIEFFAEGKSKSFKVKKNYPPINYLTENFEKIIIKNENYNKIDSLIEFFSYSQTNDTIKFNFNYITDSLSFFIYNENKIIDTISIIPKIKKRKRKFELTPIQKGNLLLTENVNISSNYPIKYINKKLIKILDKDSNLVDFKIILDTNSLKKITLDFNVSPENFYNVSFFNNSVVSIFNDSIKDTLNFTLSTNKISNYGNFKLILNHNNISDDQQIIIELTDLKGEKVIRKKIVPTTEKEINFNTLSPNNILIRLIWDKNKNGIWDTGDFLKKIQPEKVKYHNKIELKAFWDIEQEWEVNWNL